MKHTTKLYIIIAGLIALLFVREIKHAQRAYNAYMQCNERVEQAIQASSDDLLDACEARIDEILEQF
jgi:hypothetical protein